MTRENLSAVLGDFTVTVPAKALKRYGVENGLCRKFRTKYSKKGR